ncbi:Glycerophosphocholine phosphodiesterase [Coniosporium tulheliwenetii]|uniref:Glycerophosphocholine phosphodiesterase n=1 Tax=Coniosporium tulheliwenetii TaxID=3383036 RepID=A0ACC2ZKN0_9PEZI|nr:Glycerophosphocholine phosphodiesterase [Cladosporium sp. JES 115]
MKFGQNLPRNQVPEWASSYINYKGLKKLIKSAAEAVKQGGDADLAEFFFSLDRNLEDVDGFYNKKYAESARRLKLLRDRYGAVGETPEGMDKDEVEDLMGALLELRGQLRKLQWYGEVNRRGFVKITKKLDKKVPRASTQQRYLATKVDPKPFATNAQLSEDMKTINEWLSNLSDVKTSDDSSSVHSTQNMKRVSSRTMLNLPSGLLDTLDQAIRNDDAAILAKLLMEADGNEDRSSPSFQKLLLNLLQRSISCKARDCIDKLLGDIKSLNEDDDINQRNCIHRLVIGIGRSKATSNLQSHGLLLAPTTDTTNFLMPAESPMLLAPTCQMTEQESSNLLTKNDESVKLLTYLLDTLRPHQRSALQARDSYGRLPLHYAAQYGFVVICQEVIRHMQDWGQFDVSQGIDSPTWQDLEGYAPLHLSVIGGHPLTTKTLLEAENWQGQSDDKMSVRKNISKSGAVLALATKSNSTAIVKLLVEAGVDINYQDEQGETALHVAARYGYEQCARTLLEGSSSQKADIDVPENTFGWTPLFIAAVDGHLPIVELLIEAQADLDRADLSGWTAKEHAALRGHLAIAALLAKYTSSPGSPVTEASTASSGSPPGASSLEERRSNGLARDNDAAPVTKPVKTFGHRYLIKESMVLVSLGSMDVRKNTAAVKLDNIPLADAHATQLDTALSVVVSATGATGEPTIIDLPVAESISTEPMTFMTTDVSKVKLLFDIVPTYAGNKDRIVGRGVALLASVKPNVGSNRMSLQGDLSVPIVAAETLDVIGSVNFNLLVITPFTHPNMSITENRTYWKRVASTMLIGHRGLGKNQASRKSLQLGENTIQSFIAAANLGANYVEFGKNRHRHDHVPVIYHDFLVSETGIDAPVHTLTLEQFLHVSDNLGPRSISRPPSPDEIAGPDDPDVGKPHHIFRPRAFSYSVGESKAEQNLDVTERMKHTRDFKMKGYKANSRGTFIQAPFTTLEEMFVKLPESVGFNIEMKYPMLHESLEQEMDTYAVELNSFVDTVLRKVYDLGAKRNIIFSSFNPDICLLLSFKQPSIPILFLTDAGTAPVGDVRASSLQEAIRFASRWNLLGVVSAAEPLVTCPRLVKVVKESGLVCVSYGTLNNDPKNVAAQVREGIDAVIVDSVLAIRKGLTGPDAKAEAEALRAEKEGKAGVGNGFVHPKIVDTVNGVPIYENGTLGDVNGAIFS